MLFVRAINILSGIGLAILLARGLGAEGYGRYIFALTLVHMLSLPLQMGLPTLLMRQIAIYRSQVDWACLTGIIRWSLLFVSLMLGVIGLVALGYYALWPGAAQRFGDATTLYLLALLLAGTLGFMQIDSAILRGFEQVFWGSLPDSLIRPMLLLALIFCARFFVDLSPAWAMGLHVVAAFTALFWAASMVRRHCLTELPGASTSTFQFHTRNWLASLLPLSFIAGAAMINSKLDLFMLGVLSSKTNVGIYSVALQIAGTVIIGQTIVNAIIGPKIARMHASGDREELQSLVTHACRLSSLAAVTCLAIIILFGQSLVQIIFGAGFSMAYNVSLIACVGFVFSAMMGPIALVLNMTGHERTTARVIMLSAVMNAALNAVLIPLYGAQGAATATTITVIVIQTFLWHQVRRKTGLRSDIAMFVWRPRFSE